VVRTDISFLLSLGAIEPKTGIAVTKPEELLTLGYWAVCVTAGLWKPIELGIQNESLAIKMTELLGSPGEHEFKQPVAIIGGGATALDCAITARQRGAPHVELFMLEKLSEMPLTSFERQELIDFDIEVNGRIRVSEILAEGGRVAGIRTKKVQLLDGLPFNPANVRDVEGTEGLRAEFQSVIMAIGMRSTMVHEEKPGITRGYNA
jgi:NADPH-dependent glutamate synthase beta subunit-like oxidoreductase